MPEVNNDTLISIKVPDGEAVAKPSEKTSGHMTFNHSPRSNEKSDVKEKKQTMNAAAASSKNLYPVPFPKFKREMQMLCMRYLGSGKANGGLELAPTKTEMLTSRRNTTQVKPMSHSNTRKRYAEPVVGLKKLNVFVTPNKNA